jgi:hypothetical protein
MLVSSSFIGHGERPLKRLVLGLRRRLAGFWFWAMKCPWGVSEGSGLFKWRAKFEPEVIPACGRLVPCASRFPTVTWRSCSSSGACTPITSRCGGGSSVTPRKWNDVCARDSNRPTTVGGWTLTYIRVKGQVGVFVPGCRLLYQCDDRLLSLGHTRTVFRNTDHPHTEWIIRFGDAKDCTNAYNYVMSHIGRYN